MMIGKGIQSSQRKPALVPLCPSEITHANRGAPHFVVCP
jgi:hypothetical protein